MNRKWLPRLKWLVGFMLVLGGLFFALKPTKAATANIAQSTAATPTVTTPVAATPDLGIYTNGAIACRFAPEQLKTLGLSPDSFNWSEKPIVVSPVHVQLKKFDVVLHLEGADVKIHYYIGDRYTTQVIWKDSDGKWVLSPGVSATGKYAFDDESVAKFGFEYTQLYFRLFADGWHYATFRNLLCPTP